MKHDFRTHWGKWLMCALACGGYGVQASASVKSTIVKKAAVAPVPVELSQREPYNPTRTRDTMAFWEERARLDPEGAIALRNYADACLKWARESGDGQFVVLAEQAARRSLKILPGRFNAQAYSALGHSLLTQHRFQEALVVAESATVYDAQAERLRADILCELGDYDEAARALQKVPHATGDANWNALKARLLEVGGQPHAALQLWREAARSSAAQHDGPHETVAWFFFRLGNSLAALGRGDDAQQQYRKALQIFPRDYRSLTALARLAACRHDWKSTVKYGEQAAAMVPSLEVLMLLGDAYAALGQTKKARDQARLAEATTILARARGAMDNRQLALFGLDRNRNLPEALRLARADLQTRHDVYTYDTLAWALYKNKQFKEAKNAMHRALLHGTRDALMCFHAGVIAAANGDKASARKRLRQALSINPRFHPKAPRQARALLSTL